MSAIINDTKFKKDMKHYFPPEYRKIKLENYRPDLCFIKENDEVVVLELENKSDRKPYVGALLEACCFAEENEYKLLKLYFIMCEKGSQINVSQMHKYLLPYVEWLKMKMDGRLSLVVCCISQKDYKKMNQKALCVLNATASECKEVK